MSHKQSQESLKNFITNWVKISRSSSRERKFEAGGYEKTRETSFFQKRTKISHFR